MKRAGDDGKGEREERSSLPFPLISHLSKLWKSKFSLLCDVIFLVSLQGKFEIDHSWEWKGKVITADWLVFILTVYFRNKQSLLFLLFAGGFPVIPHDACTSGLSSLQSPPCRFRLIHWQFLPGLQLFPVEARGSVPGRHFWHVPFTVLRVFRALHLRFRGHLTRNGKRCVWTTRTVRCQSFASFSVLMRIKFGYVWSLIVLKSKLPCHIGWEIARFGRQSGGFRGLCNVACCRLFEVFYSASKINRFSSERWCPLYPKPD